MSFSFESHVYKNIQSNFVICVIGEKEPLLYQNVQWSSVELQEMVISHRLFFRYNDTTEILIINKKMIFKLIVFNKLF